MRDTAPSQAKATGRVGGCNPAGNPECPAEWAWTDDAKVTSASAMSRGIETSFYAELLPLAFPAYRLHPSPEGSEDEDDPFVRYPGVPPIDNFYCGDFFRNFPFKGLDRRGHIGTIDSRYESGFPNGVNPYLVYALGAKDNVDATHPSPAHPPTNVLARMFDPLDKGNNPTLGGLEMDPVDFMINAAPRDYGPHDPFGSNCDWLD